MKLSNKNYNDGVRVINLSKHEVELDEFSLIVSGLGRSGTTMISKMLSAGGIPMGVPKNDTIHEDQELSLAVEAKDKKKIEDIVNLRNQNHKIWGFKRPLIVKHRSSIEKVFRNPRYVIVFRDPLAVATRNSLSLGFNIKQALNVYAQQNQIIVDFLDQTNKPVMLVSYEKAISNPKAFAAKLGGFSRRGPNQQNQMSRVIKPNDPAYREATLRQN